jgi:hypothetical protein
MVASVEASLSSKACLLGLGEEALIVELEIPSIFIALD